MHTNPCNPVDFIGRQHNDYVDYILFQMRAGVFRRPAYRSSSPPEQWILDWLKDILKYPVPPFNPHFLQPNIGGNPLAPYPGMARESVATDLVVLAFQNRGQRMNQLPQFKSFFNKQERQILKKIEKIVVTVESPELLESAIGAIKLLEKDLMQECLSESALAVLAVASVARFSLYYNFSVLKSQDHWLGSLIQTGTSRASGNPIGRADAVGAAAGAIGGAIGGGIGALPGALVGGVAGSVGEAVGQLYDWLFP